MQLGKKVPFQVVVIYLKEWAQALFICKLLQLEKDSKVALPVGDTAGIS